MSLYSDELAGGRAEPTVDLPDPEVPAAAPTSPAPVPRSTVEKIALAAAAIVIVSAFLPWLTASAPFVGTISRSGMSGGFTDGWFTIVCGLLLAAFVWTRRPVGAMLAASGALGLAVYELIEMTGRVNDVTADGKLVSASVGIGLWLWLAAAIAGVVTTWKHQRRRTVAVVAVVWLVAGLVVSALLLGNLGRDSGKDDLSYSEFLDNVRADQVERVRVDQITGKIDGVLKNGTEFHVNGPQDSIPDDDIALLAEHKVARDYKPR